MAVICFIYSLESLKRVLYQKMVWICFYLFIVLVGLFTHK